MAVTEAPGLRKKDAALIRAVAARFPAVRSVRVFGSRARGAAGAASDLDLAIEAPGMAAKDWAALREAFEESALIHPFDLVHLDTLPPGPLRDAIERDGVVI